MMMGETETETQKRSGVKPYRHTMYNEFRDDWSAADAVGSGLVMGTITGFFYHTIKAVVGTGSKLGGRLKAAPANSARTGAVLASFMAFDSAAQTVVEHASQRRNMTFMESAVTSSAVMGLMLAPRCGFVRASFATVPIFGAVTLMQAYCLYSDDAARRFFNLKPIPSPMTPAVLNDYPKY